MKTQKRLSKKAKYISELVFEKDHFQQEIERTKKSKDFRPVWYLGEQFTRFAAKRRLTALEDELNRIDSDPTYQPWNEEVVRVDGIPYPKEKLVQAIKDSETLPEGPREMAPKGLPYKYLIEWFKDDLNRIVDHLRWSDYRTLTGNYLDKNIAFTALEEIAEGFYSDDFISWLEVGGWNFNPVRSVWESKTGVTALGSELFTLYKAK